MVPAAHNSGLFWGKKTLMIHSGTITLSYLPPIAPGLNRKEFQAKLERLIAEEATRLLGRRRGEGLRASSRGVRRASLRPARERQGTR